MAQRWEFYQGVLLFSHVKAIQSSRSSLKADSSRSSDAHMCRQIYRLACRGDGSGRVQPGLILSDWKLSMLHTTWNHSSYFPHTVNSDRELVRSCQFAGFLVRCSGNYWIPMSFSVTPSFLLRHHSMPGGFSKQWHPNGYNWNVPLSH